MNADDRKTTPSTIPTLCVNWPRFGPYHLARLQATHIRAQQLDAQIVGLETAQRDTTYEWDVVTGQTNFQREVALEDHAYEEASASRIHRAITKKLNEIRPHGVAISSYSTPDARACLSWCKRNNRVAILMTETKEDDTLRVAWKERIKSTIVQMYDAALVGGTPHKAYLEKLGFPASHIFLGCDAVDNRYFQEQVEDWRRSYGKASRLPGLGVRTPYFLASNRFIPRKNLDGLIKAYQSYRNKTLAPWRLLLLGDGPERPALEQLVNSLQVEGVVFCGFQQIQHLPAYYAHAGAFVHPALNDQWGLVVNEAMAAGLPVIVSNKAGCAQDLVSHEENGYVFNPNNLEELSHWLGVLSSPDTNRIPMSLASERIIAQWSPQTFAENMWRAFEKGFTRSGRSLLPQRTLVWGIQRLSRGVHSFHSVRD